MNSKKLIKLIEADGWVFKNAKGSHYHFTHPKKKGKVTVPHPKDDIPIGTERNILKQAGLK